MLEPNFISLVKCPHCEALASKPSAGSFEPSGWTLWSDGVETHPHYRAPSVYLKCAACNGFYSMLQAEQIKATPGGKKYQPVRDVSVSDCLTIINDENLAAHMTSGLAGRTQFVFDYLRKISSKDKFRFIIWRQYNDHFREGREMTNELKLICLREMHLLKEALEKESDSQLQLFLAELSRNLGDFNGVRIGLRKVIDSGVTEFKGDTLNKLKRKIKWKSTMHNTQVTPVMMTDGMGNDASGKSFWKRLFGSITIAL